MDPKEVIEFAKKNKAVMVDLVSGVVSPVSLKGDREIVVEDEDWTGGPLLFVFER